MVVIGDQCSHDSQGRWSRRKRDESCWSREETSLCGQGRGPVMVVRGVDQLWWSGEETSHGGHRRRPVMVVIGDKCSHGSQGRSPVMVVRGGDQSWWSGEDTSHSGLERSFAKRFGHNNQLESRW